MQKYLNFLNFAFFCTFASHSNAMKESKELTEQELRGKAAAYCVANEQCRLSVRRKLIEWGSSGEMTTTIVDWLCAERFIDERRYAKSYCESKLRYQHWGRNKVEFQLRTKGIDREIIAEGMTCVADDEYEEIMRGVAERKLKTLKGDVRVVRNKLMSFLASRGYESEMVIRVVGEMVNGD